MVDKLEGVALARAEILADLCIKAKSSLEYDFELCLQRADYGSLSGAAVSLERAKPCITGVYVNRNLSAALLGV